MTKQEGQTQIDEQLQQNAEGELPPADPSDGFEENQPAAAVASAPKQAASEPQPVDEAQKLVEEIQKLRAQCDNLLDRLARLQAEFDNYRKRVSKENTDFRDYAVAEAVRLLLPPIDSFTLALKNSQANPEEFKKGVELIHKQLQEALQKIGVQRIQAQGLPFDPHLHEAIEMVESNEAPDHHVLEELQPGYKIKDRLLRPAMVRVARNNNSVN